jgi:hypothetical protein
MHKRHLNRPGGSTDALHQGNRRYCGGAREPAIGGTSISSVIHAFEDTLRRKEATTRPPNRPRRVNRNRSRLGGCARLLAAIESPA